LRRIHSSPCIHGGSRTPIRGGSEFPPCTDTELF
jgi:hypothetical protein